MCDRTRRRLLRRALALAAGMTLPRSDTGASTPHARPLDRGLTLFLSGDVMTGRGIDQILRHPSDPVLYESYVRSAHTYVALAEEAHGPIERPVGYDAIWGDGLESLSRRAPDLRIVNLETAVTTSATPWPGKGIHYRMHPANLACLRVARIDCCVLANNHVLDWGRAGLSETLETLHALGTATAGAGLDRGEAAAPAVLATPKGRVLVFAYGAGSSSIPPDWAAGRGRSGIHRLAAVSGAAAERAAEAIMAVRRPGDLVVASIHWGGNWGYAIPEGHRTFAHRLIDSGAADLVHGHSSHHPLGIEVYRERPIFYGCGDLLNDYEGITGHGSYRPELALMYYATLDPGSGRLQRLEADPMRIERLRLNRARRAEARWLRDRLARESEPFGVAVRLGADRTLRMSW